MLPDLSKVQLRVVGSGPQRKRWQRMADKLGISNRIEWVGRVPDVKIQTHYSWADAFAFTSLRDTTGTVVLEALANGLPVIAADHQGVGDIVNEDCGIKVPVAIPRKMATHYRDALLRLLDDPSILARLQAGALQRAAEYAWPEQGKRMRDYYRQVLGDAFLWDGRSAEQATNTTVQHA